MTRRGSKVSEQLDPSRMVGNDYRIIGKKIGAGNFGEVRIGEEVETKVKVAVKIEKIPQNKNTRWASWMFITCPYSTSKINTHLLVLLSV